MSRSEEVAQDVLGQLGEGQSIEEVAFTLAGRSEVVETLIGSSAIRFRLEGGRPEWVFTRTAADVMSLGGTLPVPASAPSLPVALDPVRKSNQNAKSALVISPFYWQWAATGMSDEVDSLEVLLKSTRDYGAKGGGAVSVLRNSLALGAVGPLGGGSGGSQNGAGGSQTTAPPAINYGVSRTSFTGWTEHEVIHLSTHGGTVDEVVRVDAAGNRVRIKLTPARTVLLTGEVWSQPTVGATPWGVARMWTPISDSAAVASVLGTGSVTRTGSGKLVAGDFVGLTTDWFKNEYKGGLSNSLVFLSACSSGKESDLVQHLASGGSTVVGWTDDMGLSVATAGAMCFWRTMLGDTTRGVSTDMCGATIDLVMKRNNGAGYTGGASVQDAFDIITRLTQDASTTLGSTYKGTPIVASGSQVWKSTTPEPQAISGAVQGAIAGAQLAPTGDVRNRAIEIVRMVEGGTTREYEDGDLVALTGQAGDGIPDTLVAELEAFGMGPSDAPDAMTLHVDVDGTTQVHSFSLKHNREPDIWRTDLMIPLDIDLTPNQPIDVEVWADFPDGRTRWLYKQLEHGCNAPDLGELRARFVGAFARSLPRGTQANRAQLVQVQGFGWQLILANRLNADFQVGVQLQELPAAGTQVHIVDTGIPDLRVMGGIDFDQFGKTSWTAGDASIDFQQVTDQAACGKITVDLTGSQRTPSMPRTVNTRFEATFWAEIRR